MHIKQFLSQPKLPLVPPSTRMWEDGGGGISTGDLLERCRPASDAPVAVQCWHPSTARDVSRHALKMGFAGAGLAGASIAAVGLVRLASGGALSEVARQAGMVAGFLVPLVGLGTAALGVWEAASENAPVKGTISAAGANDLVFQSDELPGPVSLTGYLQACEEAYPQGPLPPGNYLLQWNGRKATGSDQQLEGASRKAASMVNDAWSSLRSAGLHRQREADQDGLHWVRCRDGSGSLTWKPSDGTNVLRAQFLPGQGLCVLTIREDQRADSAL